MFWRDFSNPAGVREVPGGSRVTAAGFVSPDAAAGVGEYMAEKFVGGCVVLMSLLLGCFLAVASAVALIEGQRDFYVPVLLALGVALLVGGFWMMLRLVWSKPAKHPKVEDEIDERW